jgi:hypothetical protein
MQKNNMPLFMLFVLLLLMCLSDSFTNLTSSLDNVVKNYKKLNKTKKQNKNIKTTKNNTLTIEDVKKGFKPGYLTPTFDNIKDAKNFFNYFNKDNCNVLISFDIKKQNEKIVKNWFVADTQKELYNYIVQNPNVPLYEQINVEDHKLFFDVDINKGEKGFDNFSFIDYKKQIENELTNVLLNEKLNFVWLNSSSYEKHSYHLIVNGVSCNQSQNCQIKDYLNNKIGSLCLDDVYSKNRCFRMWGCSKFGENRPLKKIGKHSFRETLVNFYGNEKVEKISAKISLLEENPINQTNFCNPIGNVPFNNFLMKNFVRSKYQKNVYVRKYKNISLPCPICKSLNKDPNKEKHHKKTDVYIFKKNNNTYIGCFRAKKWGGDRYFLNLESNKIEYLPKNNISPTIVSAITTYKNCNLNDVDKEIKELLNQTVNFGKYNEKLVKDLFKDTSYVNYIIANFGERAQARQVCEKLVNYFNKVRPIAPSLPKKTIKPKPTVKEMVNVISKKTKTIPSLWENMSKKELEMHYGMMFKQ